MNVLDLVLERLDTLTQRSSRSIAQRTSRRGFVGKMGTLLVGSSVLPLLPVARSFGAEGLAEIGDPQSCDYWRYCALGGALCSCCGGSMNAADAGDHEGHLLVTIQIERCVLAVFFQAVMIDDRLGLAMQCAEPDQHATRSER